MDCFLDYLNYFYCTTVFKFSSTTAGSEMTIFFPSSLKVKRWAEESNQASVPGKDWLALAYVSVSHRQDKRGFHVDTSVKENFPGVEEGPRGWAVLALGVQPSVMSWDHCGPCGCFQS